MKHTIILILLILASQFSLSNQRGTSLGQNPTRLSTSTDKNIVNNPSKKPKPKSIFHRILQRKLQKKTQQDPIDDKMVSLLSVVFGAFAFLSLIAIPFILGNPLSMLLIVALIFVLALLTLCFGAIGLTSEPKGRSLAISGLILGGLASIGLALLIFLLIKG